MGRGSRAWQDSKAQVVFGLASASDENWKGGNSSIPSLTRCSVPPTGAAWGGTQSWTTLPSGACSQEC